MEGIDLRRLRALLTLLRAQGVATFEMGGVRLTLGDAPPVRPVAKGGDVPADEQPRPTFMSGPHGELERMLWPDGAPFAREAG